MLTVDSLRTEQQQFLKIFATTKIVSAIFCIRWSITTASRSIGKCSYSFMLRKPAAPMRVQNSGSAWARKSSKVLLVSL